MTDLSNEVADMTKEPEWEAARRVLRKRYEWEIDAIAQDIYNKLDMGILKMATIKSYLSNLLQSHPRVRELSLAAETHMVSRFGSPNRDDEVPSYLDYENVEKSPWMLYTAYCVMGVDVAAKLKDMGVNLVE
jgi:hypothetical protein